MSAKSLSILGLAILAVFGVLVIVVGLSHTSKMRAVEMANTLATEGRAVPGLITRVETKTRCNDGRCSTRHYAHYRFVGADGSERQAVAGLAEQDRRTLGEGSEIDILVSSDNPDAFVPAYRAERMETEAGFYGILLWIVSAGALVGLIMAAAGLARGGSIGVHLRFAPRQWANTLFGGSTLVEKIVLIAAGLMPVAGGFRIWEMIRTAAI